MQGQAINKPTFLFPETISAQAPPPYHLDTSPPLYSDVPDRTNSTGSIPTHAIPFTPGVTFTRPSLPHPEDDDEIIIVTVRISPPTDNHPLPASKNLFKRLAHSKTLKVKAFKMPRSEYKRYFARDTHGSFIGTSPERPWTLEELQAEFGIYQSMPIATRYCTASSRWS